MRRIGTVSTIAILAAMLVSVNRRSPTRKLSLGATTMLKGVADEGRGYNYPKKYEVKRNEKRR